MENVIFKYSDLVENDGGLEKLKNPKLKNKTNSKT